MQPPQLAHTRVTTTHAPADPAQHVKAVQGIGPHHAPLGNRFYRAAPDTMFPREYNNTLFIAVHGSLHRWGAATMPGLASEGLSKQHLTGRPCLPPPGGRRSTLVGYRVDMVRFDERGEVAAYRPFITGFAQNEGTDGGSFWGASVWAAAPGPALHCQGPCV